LRPIDGAAQRLLGHRLRPHPFDGGAQGIAQFVQGRLVVGVVRLDVHH
jgi:hypothetical protein